MSSLFLLRLLLTFPFWVKIITICSLHAVNQMCMKWVLLCMFNIPVKKTLNVTFLIPAIESCYGINYVYELLFCKTIFKTLIQTVLPGTYIYTKRFVFHIECHIFQAIYITFYWKLPSEIDFIFKNSTKFSHFHMFVVSIVFWITV